MSKHFKRKPPQANNQKITSFFKKRPIVTTIDSSDEDIIENSPVRTTKDLILEDVTNSKPINQISKRKCSDESQVGSKKIRVNVEIEVPSLQEWGNEVSMKRQQKTPEKMRSPKKRSPIRKSPTRKKTPQKLYAKSPNVNDFKVEVLEKFVRITPSKSQANDDGRRTPDQKVECLPSTSKHLEEAQGENERTPVNKMLPRISTPVSGKAKIKLNFQELNAQDVVNMKSKSPNLESMFDETWMDDLQIDTDYNLDLSIPQRCKVLEIVNSRNKQTLTVLSINTKEKAICIVKDFWINVKLEKNCIIYVNAVLNGSEWIVDNFKGLLVYEPDHLISCTTVVGASFCKRKSILKDRYGGFDSSNKVMIVGILVHSLLQTCLEKNIQNSTQIRLLLKTMMAKRETNFRMYESSLDSSELLKEVDDFIPRIEEFMRQYLRSNDGKYKTEVPKGNWGGRIDTVRDIEENIWCPQLGIKGKVDVSVDVRDKTMPLELKTGKPSMSLEHRGQIVLYIMMMRKLGYQVDGGLLLYLRHGVLKDIPINSNEQRDIMILRNELAYYLNQQPRVEDSKLIGAELPPPISHRSACEKCEYNLPCCMYLKSDGADLSGYKLLSTMQDNILVHLKSEHIEYFTHWTALLAIEDTVIRGQKAVSDIYTKTPETREKNGKCIINLNIRGAVTECDGLYPTTFTTKSKCNFFSSGLGIMSYIVVSTPERSAIATGLAIHTETSSITVNLDRDLTNKKKWGEVFHLDSYDSQSANTFNYTCLMYLMENTDRAAELRRLMIEKEKPTFEKQLPTNVGKLAVTFLKGFNKMQQRAVIKALATNEYMLIKGMPGTGKTATIVVLIRFLVKLNKSVLITSHTHSAIDNVCMRLLEFGVNFIRLGSVTRTHPQIQKHSEKYLTKDCQTPSDFEAVYNSVNVIASTCIGTKHPIFSKRVLDYCLVDESTQVFQCELVRALSASKKFILIGDPEQLPPVVKNREAQMRGLSESLFERLQSPHSTITLTLNYRMNKTITALANSLTYNGELLCASEAVANATLTLPEGAELCSTYSKQEWLLQVLNDFLDKSVCVLNTGPVWDRNYVADWIKKVAYDKDDEDEETAGICTNPSETAIIYCLIGALIKGGKSPESIGVISPYRAQVAQLSYLLKSKHVEVSTVDQFQGRDKEIILYSCTKSRDLTKTMQISKFSILEDKRRLTVAITRAKHKFILVADVESVKEYSPFKKLFESIANKNYINLKDGELGYNLDRLVAEIKP